MSARGTAAHRDLLARAEKRLTGHIATHWIDAAALLICARYEGQERVLLGLVSPGNPKRLAAIDAEWARITEAAARPQPDVHPPKAPPVVRLAVWVALSAASWLVIAAIVAWWPWSAGVAATLIVAVIAWFGGRDAYLNWRAGREADR